MNKRRFLIITGGNEGALTALMLRGELVSNYGSLDHAPSIVRYLALNTDGFSDAQYPEEIRFKDPEKIKLDVAEIQNLIADEKNFGHLTSDLPSESVVAEDTTRGAGRTPSQGELGIRYHLSDFSKRLDLILQQLFDPQVFPSEGEIYVVIVASGCTGTGRGIHLEVAIETKRKLIQSGRRHRIISYILSPEGLSPEDLIEKEKVFYAHLKELNAVALGEEYQRPFMLDKKQQTWTGFPLDYVFLVSARSETVSLASLREVKQVVVNHLLYEMTSVVGSRMESFRVDCRQRLRSKDGNGLPTFLSRLGIAAIDLPVRVLKQLSAAQAGADICQTILGDGTSRQNEEQVLTQMGLTLSQVETAFGKNLYIQRIHRVSAPLNEDIRDASPSNWLSLIDAKRVALDAIINEMQKGLAKRRQTLFDSFGEQLVENVRSLMTSKNTGVLQAAGYLEQLNQALGLSDDEPGLISTCSSKINQSESDKLEADIKRLKQEITDAQRGLLKKSLHALGINRPTEIRDQLVSAVEAYYTHECQKQVFREIVSLYKALGERSIDQLNSVRSVAQRFETAQKDFLRKIDSLKTANEFALAEYLREKDEYLALYREHVSENDKGNATQSVLVKLQNDLFTVTEMSKEELTQAIGEVISAEKMVDFVEKLDFTDSFDEKFPSSQEKESALRRSFLRAKPLTIVDANYAKSKTGVEAESRELVIVPKGADESLINLITKTYPVSEDQIITVSEKRLLVLREEHGFPINAVTFVRDECASQYKSQSVKEGYHITKWAANYPDPIPIVALENDNLDDEDVLFLSIGLGIVSFKNDNGGLFYLDDSIPIPLAETLPEAKEKISVDGREGESDREALLRLIAQQERVLLSSLGVKKAFQQSAEKMPQFARELRDIHQKRYEA